MGFSVAYAYSDALCTSTKLYILLTLLLISIALYIAVELDFKNTKENLKENTCDEAKDKESLPMDEKIKFLDSNMIS